MTYISYLISLDANNHEIEIAFLNQMGVEAFIEHDDALEAFVENNEHPTLCDELEIYLTEKRFPFERIIHVSKDWNAEWEMNFKPIAIGNDLFIRAPFHSKEPFYKQELIIAPKMAFGTGHHETTSMILEWMLTQDLNEKDVLDFGCGTGILGIFAAKCGARKLYFIDNDPLAIENTQENIALNQLPEMELQLGSYDVIPQTKFDLILANITRNILSDGLSILSKHLKPQGKIAMSGFLFGDSEYMLEKINQAGLHLIEQKQKNDWLCFIAEKQ